MSEVVRLTLVSHAMTDAMSAGRFPTDEPLNSVGYRQVDVSIDLGITDSAFCGPEKRTRQTAELLGLQASIEQRLADLDCGRWRGDVLGGVRPADLAIWLTDPTRAPHGGETVVDLINRVRDWMDTLTTRRTRLVAVTHPAVIRAAILLALDAPAKSFWRMDIAPVSRTVLHCRGESRGSFCRCWPRFDRGSLEVNPVVTTPNVKVQRKSSQIFATAAHSEPARDSANDRYLN